MSVLFNDVVINKLSGGLGRRLPDQDMVSGLLFNGKDTTGEIVEGSGKKTIKLLEDEKLYRLASLDDAKALKINKTYDKEGESAYYQIAQFFRLNPSGDLFLYKDSKATSYADLVSKAEDMQLRANGEIRQLAVIFKEPENTTDNTDDQSSGDDKTDSTTTKSKTSTKTDKNAKTTTTVDDNTNSGGNADAYFAKTKKAIEAAKTVTEKAFANHSPLEILLEGKDFDASKEPIDIKGVNASGVSVVVAMDQEKALEANYKNTAAVGVLLGAVSKAKVSENIAWIEKFNVSGEGFSSVGFVGGTKLTTEGAQKTLDEAKYIFTRSHIGVGGVYFNDSHTCTKKESDFAYIESNRVIHKAARLARRALLPKVNSPVLVDPDNGTLPPSVVKGYETLCRAALERMVANGEASEIDVYVDPLQNILADSMLQVKIEVIPAGTARRITVDLGFKNPFGKTN